jgi:hypothetical protein
VNGPEPTDYRQANEHLMRAAMLLAPTGVEQRAFSDLTQSWQYYDVRTVLLLEALLDGVTGKGWPPAVRRAEDSHVVYDHHGYGHVLRHRTADGTRVTYTVDRQGRGDFRSEGGE